MRRIAGGTARRTARRQMRMKEAQEKQEKERERSSKGPDEKRESTEYARKELT